ncbi:conserved hypothetical protein [Fibrobacter succinogenes subsp. succinogenes S85]|uniref:HhH-GPD domain-containing protein n=2 Tax=Fibrobacter succinogenes (strain ATCC 19169 / S85) TaxID=59374 RepID=D9S4P9_FIBSS|nr:conserved hypothetical protein [Fibrobacter succinogenes subsp. succinogenes S85]
MVYICNMSKTSIQNYKQLIQSLPVKNQSAHIKKKSWARISYKGKTKIEQIVFKKDDIEISRKDILDESNADFKIIKTLMWGYPTGGRNNNIQKSLEHFILLQKILSKAENKNLSLNEANSLLNELDNIKGLGPSTWSKLLYFFNISFCNQKCQIFDLKIVDSLNKKQFCEFEEYSWKQDKQNYFKYISLLSDLANKLDASPDQIENFLFFYNLNYKF